MTISDSSSNILTGYILLLLVGEIYIVFVYKYLLFLRKQITSSSLLYEHPLMKIRCMISRFVDDFSKHRFFDFIYLFIFW